MTTQRVFPSNLRSRTTDEPSCTPEDRLALALAEYAAAVDRGEPLSNEALLAKYADVADELAGCLDSLDFIHHIAPQLNDDISAAGRKGGAQIRPLATLGDYRLIREIGRGGMGVVYEEEQLSLGRRVALKVLPFAAMLGDQQVKRFHNEARAAATLEHPNIVAIHSVGTERGVHYYAMQLVEGRNLAEVIQQLRDSKSPSPPPAGEAHHAEENSGEGADTSPVAVLSTIPDSDSQEFFRMVARLGIQAAEALDYAHQQGIVHRDVKPGNLLVDADGKLWVTDFGLARIEADAGMTMTGDLLGTLRYMSPEQALAKRVVVDHRTDVYSLGATLYELLTLQTPYSGNDRQELLKKIAFEDPKKLRQHNPRIPEDLETIVLKSMEKYPEDRYTTAQELADDLERFTRDQPIQAKPPTLLQRGTKWSRRHQGHVAATAVVLGLLLAAATSATLLIAREQLRTQAALEEASEQRNQADEQRKRAQEEASRAEQSASESKALVEFFIDDLMGAVDPEKTLGDVVTVQQVVAEAERKIDSQFSDQPLLEAAVRRALGQVHASLGNYDRAEEQLKSALSIQQRLLGTDAATLKTMSHLADVLSSQKRTLEAHQLCLRTLELMRRSLGDEHPDTVNEFHQLAVIYVEEGNLLEGEKTLREAWRLQQRVLGDDAEETLTSQGEMGVVAFRLGRQEEGLQHLREAVKRSTALWGEDHPKSLYLREGLAAYQSAFSGWSDEVRSTIEDILSTKSRIYGPYHPETLKSVHHQLQMHLGDGNITVALQQCREVHEALKKELGDDHPRTLKIGMEYARLICVSDVAAGLSLAEGIVESYRNRFGPDAEPTLWALHGYSELLFFNAKYERQREILQRLLEARRRVSGPENPHTLQAELELGECLVSVGQRQEGRALLEDTLKRHLKVFGQTHYSTLRVKNELARACDDLQQQRQILRESLDMHRRLYGAGFKDTLSTTWRLANTFIQQNASKDELVEARDLLLAGLQAAKENPTVDQYVVYEMKLFLALCYRSLGDYPAAIEMARSCAAWYREVYGEAHHQTYHSLLVLGYSLDKAGEHAEAVDILRRLIKTCAEADNDDHRLVAMNYLGLVYRMQDELDKAAAVLQDVVDEKLALEGMEDSSTQVSMRALSGVFQDQGRLREAYALDQQVAEARYRASKWGAAAYTFGEALKNAETADEQAALGFYLAMALWKEGKAGAAREAFLLAEQAFDEATPEPSLKEIRAQAVKLIRNGEEEVTPPESKAETPNQ